MKFAFQILQKWADKEGSSALAVWKGFVFVLMFEFSVATTSIIIYLAKVTSRTNVGTFLKLMATLNQSKSCKI